MTEAEWLAFEDPEPMLKFLRGKATDRKLRLFACACTRRNSRCSQSVVFRRAVEAAELRADGLAGADELYSVAEDDDDDDGVYIGPTPAVTDSESYRAARAAAVEGVGFAAFRIPYSGGFYHSTRDNERAAPAALLRCIVGNPFRLETATAIAWLTRHDSTVPKLAQAIYAARRFADLPFLADALEDAGCDDADVLAHCRSGGEHVRGCWVVDLLLGKS
jgi:hypothetical protein